MNKILLVLTIFSFGYVLNDVLEEYDLNLIDKVRSEVAGMDYRDLRRDRDFKKAVKYIVERCSVSGYVDSDYLYSTSISC
ncbi:hypothetical protein OAT37_04245 [Alphaproteobacteria bacterium]|nr:hypothetical protein [Alphaproteobacteria bacterium]